MKNKILWSTLFTLINTQIHADLNQPTTPPAQNIKAINPAPSAPTPAGQDALAPVPAATPEPVINCEYKIPAETKIVDQSLVKTWAEKAVTQAFDFNPNNLDAQLQELEPCFTEQGWTGFSTALKKSGNLDAIKAQKLTVSSQVEGQVVIMEALDNVWKIKLPLQVVYQNDKEKVTQLLSVELTVGRKMTGDLGITQMIAAPTEPVAQENPPGAESNTMNPPSNTTNTAPNPAATTAPVTTPVQPAAPEKNANVPTPTPAAPGQPTLPATQPPPTTNTP
jgi:hypothetical protein